MQTLTRTESVLAPFRTLFSRWPKAPKLICYDFACGLHRSFLNREPRFIRKTTFVSDRFHQKNHSGCNSGYNLKSYPQYANLNSETAEQTNSRLVKLAPSLSYMRPEIFFQSLKFYIASLNKTKCSSSV